MDILKLVKIEDIVAEYVNIENSSKPDDLRALCPFHADKNPSFSVNPKKQVFFCFGCKKGGNVIDFISYIENISKEESIDFLKSKYGILEQRNLLSLLDDICLYYEDKSPAIKEYLEKRKISQYGRQTYRLGYSGSDSLELHREFSSYKNELKELQLIESKYEGTPSELNLSFFTNRLMIPIITYKGVIGFVGRTLIDNPSKYLNSFDNLYFHRRTTLYGLNKKAIETMKIAGYAYLVEGMFDVQRMQTTGYYNTIGGLGTGLTIEQAKVLKRYCNHVLVLYDGDNAGIKATITTAKILVSIGLTFDVIHLPLNYDPDSYLIEYHNLDDLEYSEGLKFFKEKISKEEFIEVTKQSDSSELIPDSLFKEYKIPRWTIQSKPQRVSLNTKKLTKYTPEMHLALFLDCFPEFKVELPTTLQESFLKTQSLPEVINLYYKNPYRNIKEPKNVFEIMVKELYEK